VVDGWLGFLQIAYSAGIRKGASEKAISKFDEWLDVNMGALLFITGGILSIFIMFIVLMWMRMLI
jgi:hypothetical protein